MRSGKLRKPDLSILILGQTHAWKCCIPDSRFESVIAMYRMSVTASESAKSMMVQQRKVPKPAAFRLSSTLDRAPFSFASSGWVKMMSTSLDSAFPLRYPPTIVYSAPGCGQVSLGPKSKPLQALTMIFCRCSFTRCPISSTSARGILARRISLASPELCLSIILQIEVFHVWNACVSLVHVAVGQHARCVLRSPIEGKSCPIASTSASVRHLYLSYSSLAVVAPTPCILENSSIVTCLLSRLISSANSRQL